MRNVLFVSLALLFIAGALAAADPHLRGDLGAHDPSTIIKCKDRYYLFATGNGIESKWSTDKVFWNRGPRIFQAPPAWTTNAVPEFTGTFWAPDVILLGNRYCVYYSISSWGKQVSAIGMVSNPTLDPTDPAYKWTDHGPVIASGVGSPYNTIDPSVVKDVSGNPWLCFGSYWNGIYLVQLDPTTGLRISANSPTYHLAWNGSIEASCLYRRGAWYYLFVNYDSCCAGVNSGYNVRVGRSQSITGPYLDRYGRDLRQANNTTFLEGTGKYTGPGHVGVLSEDGTDYFSYHYYDAGDYSRGYNAFGTAKFDIRRLYWTADGWPSFTNTWSATYDFDAGARDLNGQYTGLLRGNTETRVDPIYGKVLSLSGTNAWVDLPAGVAYARSFEAVVKWDGGGAWQRIFDFGTDTSAYVMLTPSSGQGVLRCDIRANNSTHTIQSGSPLPIGAWTHVALTLDGTNGSLYVNGTRVAQSAVPISPLQTRAQTNRLGRSKFTADPDFKGSIASFRIHGQVLSQAQIVAPRIVINEPSSGVPYEPGPPLEFNGYATDFMGRTLAPSNLTWRVDRVAHGVTNTELSSRSGVTNGLVQADTNTVGFYRVSLSARDGAGRIETTFTDVFPNTNSIPASWASFYPFQSDARDASNRYHGTLVSGASIQSDAALGNVLNLSGAGQYLSLPAAASQFQTLSAWVKWRGGNAWQRVFDFGRDTAHWFFLTPRNNAGHIECAITTESSSYTHVLQPGIAFPLNKWTHVAVTLNGREAVLYLDGTPVAVNNGVNLFALDVAATRAWFGRSMYPADAYFSGQIDSLALNSRALSIEEILAPTLTISQPTASLLFGGSDTIPYSGSATDYSGKTLPAANLVWTAELWSGGTPLEILHENAGSTSGSFGVGTNAPLSTNIALRLHLSATDAQGRTGTTHVDLCPAVVEVKLDTHPSGLSVTVDGGMIVTPSALSLVRGFPRRLSAPLTQTRPGTNYSFFGWTGSAPATHWFTPIYSTNLIASYLPPSIAAQVDAGELTLRWPVGLSIYTTTNLTPDADWQKVIQEVSVQDGRTTLRISTDRPKAFYRLQSE